MEREQMIADVMERIGSFSPSEPMRISRFDWELASEALGPNFRVKSQTDEVVTLERIKQEPPGPSPAIVDYD
jgi:hypothetical protein